ncbi:helix-turn-helix domain-containing protein [Cylindrospermopsis curvispora]|uniref:helix-turn-helix domain-containing protein n=1 Tax=Cylindrospermopsis curvispora TaxID=747548 RepID=UPI001F2DDD69
MKSGGTKLFVNLGELKPNNKQVTLFRQHCGVARHAYNFGNEQETEASTAIC